MSFSIPNKHVEALRDPWNLLALGLCFAFGAWGAKPHSALFLLLFLAAELCYLWIFPDVAWYRAYLQRRYDKKATGDLDWLERQVFKVAAPDMKERLRQLREQRLAIAKKSTDDHDIDDTPIRILSSNAEQQALENERRLREILWRLDCLLETFLKVSLDVAQLRRRLRAIIGLVTSQEPNSPDAWECAKDGPCSGEWRERAVALIEQRLSRDETEIRVTLDQDVILLRKQFLDNELSTVEGLREEARSIAATLKTRDEQSETLADGFRAVIKQVTYGYIHKALDDLEKSLKYIRVEIQDLPALPARRFRNLPRLVGALKWITANEERRRLLACLFLGSLVISLFGFGVDQLNRWTEVLGYGEHYLSHGQSWELGALVGNVGFVALFYCWVRLPQNGVLIRLFPLAKLVPFLLLAVVGGLSLVTWKALLQYRNERWHVACLLAIAIVFLLIDLLLAVKHDDERHRRDYLGSLLIADIPVVGAVVVLTIYQLVHGHPDNSRDALEMSAFISGAVSFQFISSNVLFAMIQGGVFRRISPPGAASPAEEPLSQTAAALTEQRGKTGAR